MKTKLIAVLFAAMPFVVFSQTFENDTLTSSTGFKVYKGLELKLGHGSQPNGMFSYIQWNQSSFLSVMSATSDQTYNRNQSELNKNASGSIAIVKKIVKRQSIYKPIVSIKGRGTSWEIDLESAIESGEVVVPDEYKPKKVLNVKVEGATDLADQLKKLKDLKDQGILSEDEFNKAKAKLLNQ
ncbi:SHOCT domain-containing protein [Rhizosphaericola mali]|uniref:SHOCT domain-containing protein n=1 Tax=Rhizosphaericola mali TaxID=2545455 RepID=A0A5P2G0V4_9BACT|nr:SHOCT domain-containing protein [Rhizosphaericola mali]QES88817.1 SHOCT domain-containing protein [Rhizosphaericola mali]